MTIALHVAPRQVLTWEDFCQVSPPHSIALDGFVRGGPRFDPSGPRANFNHHEDVDRLATRSTCAQVLMAIRQGLFTAFRQDGEATAHLWVNDCDEDVCTAVALLRHHYLVEGAMNPLVNRLVAMEDALDCTAGAYPFPADLPVLRQLAWVFEPYRQFRAAGRLHVGDARAYESVITDVESRIFAHVMGGGREIPLDTRYERIGGGSGWVMVREVGAQSRTGMFADGVRVFLSVRELPGGRHAYVVGKFPFVPLDLRGLVDDLNAAEGCATGDCWGGGDTIVGSPREAASGLLPTEVGRLLEQRLGVGGGAQ